MCFKVFVLSFLFMTTAWAAREVRTLDDLTIQERLKAESNEEPPVDIPIESFGAGVAGALAAFGGKNLVIRLKKKV